MSRSFLPPHFASVALAVTLVCGAWAGTQHALGTLREDASAQQAASAAEASLGNETIPAPRAHTRSFAFRHLSHDVMVEGSPLSRKRIRRRLRGFRDTVRALEESGADVGVYLLDLGTGARVTYAADDDLYPASSIKGPYVACVYEELVDTGLVDAAQVEALARPIVIDSDNDAYRGLRSLCGDVVFADWAVRCGAIEEGTTVYADFASHYYPSITPRQLGLLWEHVFYYLDDDGGSGPALAEVFAQRVESPLRAGLDEDVVTITKAGWYPADDGAEFTATADAGIVLDGEYAYVVVVMTTLPDDLDGLAKAVHGIWKARRTLG